MESALQGVKRYALLALRGTNMAAEVSLLT